MCSNPGIVLIVTNLPNRHPYSFLSENATNVVEITKHMGFAYEYKDIKYTCIFHPCHRPITVIFHTSPAYSGINFWSLSSCFAVKHICLFSWRLCTVINFKESKIYQARLVYLSVPIPYYYTLQTAIHRQNWLGEQCLLQHVLTFSSPKSCP